jgi:mitochondrial distribution and morphology protein 31
VPKWKGSQISFKNVFISRRPREADDSLSRAELGKRAAARFDVGHGPALFHDEDDPYLLPIEPIYKNANYSMFDLNVDSIDVTLSLTRWLDGKGLVKDAEVKGVRGVLGMSNVI